MNNFITDEEVEKALNYLASSVIAYKDAKATMKHLEHYRKSVRALEILKSDEKSATAKAVIGEASDAYLEVLTDYKEAVAEFTMIEAYRKVAELKIEVWRTISASNRRGNI